LAISNNKPNSLIYEINSTNKKYEYFNSINSGIKKINKSKGNIFKKYKVLENSKKSNNSKSNNKEKSNNNKIGQTSNKISIITKKYKILNSGYYRKC
jgi:hypothetical protein